MEKTREELYRQLKEAQDKIDSLKLNMEELRGIHAGLEFKLKERIKELNCLNSISGIMDTPGLTEEEACNRFVEIIPPGWQFPGIAQACLTVNDKVFKTPGFEESSCRLIHTLKTGNYVSGWLEVSYPEHKVPDADPVFLPEESDLLGMIAQKIGNYLENAENLLKLSISEQKFSRLVGNISDIVFEILLNGTIRYVSPAIERVLGYQPGEIVGANFLPFIFEADRDMVLNKLQDLENRNFSSLEYRLRCKNGSVRWVRTSTLPLMENGNMVGGTGTMTDITEQREAVAEIREREALYRSILGASPDVISITDLSGKLLFSSPKAIELFGYDNLDALNGHSLLEFIQPEFHDKAINEITNMLQGNMLGAEEYVGIRSDGSLFDMEVNGEVIRDENGQPSRMIFITRDITKRKQTENQLTRTEELFRKMVESINDVIYEVSADGTVTYVSPAIERILGYTPEELIGQNFFTYMYPDDRPFLMNALINLADEDFSYLEYRYFTKVGEMRWVRSSTTPIFDGDKLTGGRGVLYDIHERKMAQDRLAASELKYKSLFDNSPEGYLILVEGKFIECNKASETIIGGNRSMLLGLSPVDISPEFQLNGIKSSDHAAEMIRLANQKGNHSFEWKHLRFDGQEILVAVNLSVIEYENNQVLLVTWKDITEQRAAEIMLRKLSRAVEQSPVSIIITDLNASMEYVNPSFEETTGYKLYEVIGKRTNILRSEKMVDSVYKEMWETISSGREWYGEWQNKKKSGQLYWESISISPITDVTGKITNFLAVKQDITERKEAEMKILDLNSNLEQKIEERTSQLAEINDTLLKEIEERKNAEAEIRKARNDAEQANMAKSEFLSRMSHELRTPMNSILGFAQLLEMGELNQGQKKGVSHILRSGKHLLDLINEVLDISRIEAGRLSLSLEPVQLGGIITETLDIIRPQAVNQGLTLHLAGSESNKCYVKSDRQRLKQILLNLVTNAVKYNREDGSVVVSTGIIARGSKYDDLVRISISDTGVGISAEDVPKLFTPFERIGAEKSATEGTGLGLAVVKKLADAMGGLVGVESTLGVGSTFWIEMPLCDSQLESAEKSGMLTEIKLGEEVSTGHILYIEDNASNVELVEQILTTLHAGIHLITSAYGRDAVRLATANKPDLILLDLNLPDIHGSEVLDLLQKEEKTCKIPVVVISADAMPKSIDALLKNGARKFLTKPLDVMELLKVIDEYVRKKSS